MRAFLLVVLVFVSIVIFALVSELSRVSQQGLDEAIVRDSGLRGSYTLAFDPALQMSQQEQYDAIMKVARSLDLTLWGYFEELPAVQSECPPFEQVGEQQLRILWKSPGVPFPLDYGQVSGIDTSWCINGQRIPQSALFVADPAERSVYDSSVYISPYYKNLILLNTLGPVRFTFTLVSGRDGDMTGVLKQRLVDATATAAREADVNVQAATLVLRKDRSGANVKDAAEGAAVTYGVIGWGVLALAALALLVMQISYVRQRMWFYGLLQSLGASRLRIAALLLVDNAVIVIAGVGAALAALWLGDGVVRRFAMSAFGVDAHVLSVSLIPQLVVGTVLILCVATIWPLTAALHRDPVTVLEAPRD